jgi:hypothetical protein
MTTTEVSLGKVDVSVRTIYQLALSSNTSVGYLMINTEPSVGRIGTIAYASNASVGYLMTVTEVSLGKLNASVNILNSSMGIIYPYVFKMDVSVAQKCTSINTVTSTYYVSSSDNNKILECNASLNIWFSNLLGYNNAVGNQITFTNVSTGYVTFNASAGVTLRSSGTALKTQWTGATAYMRSASEWFVMGALS